ncbi:MAG TPA: hypothetical protein VKA08_11340 [Balneolales bacterium]|nr:hypothetical protein [Balneolales bacterium]
MMNKRILITFDYELFLGDKSGNINHCLIEPTNRLLNIFDAYGIKTAIFFIDTTYLIQLEQQVDQYEKARKDYETVKSQLTDILKRGHILFPHLHPHWVDARYNPDKNEWSIINYRYYRFHNLPDPQKKTLFEDSIRILTEVQDASGIHHPIEGYRAGGWSLMPFSDFRPYFEKHEIFYDLSAISKSVSHTTAQDYDYRSISGDNWYTFDKEVSSPVDKGPFLEHPVSTISLSFYRALADRLWRKVNWKLGYRSMGNGRGVEGKPADSSTENTTDYEYLGIENLSQSTYPVYKQFIKNHNYIHFLSHPKMVSKVNLYYWNRLLGWMRKNYTADYSYKITEFEQSRQRSYHDQAQ